MYWEANRAKNTNWCLLKPTEISYWLCCVIRTMLLHRSVWPSDYINACESKFKAYHSINIYLLSQPICIKFVVASNFVRENQHGIPQTQESTAKKSLMGLGVVLILQSACERNIVFALTATYS